MTAYFYLILGLVVMILCGNWLVIGSVQLARYFKISTLVVGFDIMMMFLVTFLLLFFSYNGIIGFFEGLCLLTILIAYKMGRRLASFDFFGLHDYFVQINMTL